MRLICGASSAQRPRNLGRGMAEAEGTLGIRVAIHHLTRYTYDRPVTLLPQVVRLRPAPHCRTPIPAYSLRAYPKEHFLNWQQDPFGNYQARLVFPKKSAELAVEVDLVAEMTVI